MNLLVGWFAILLLICSAVGSVDGPHAVDYLFPCPVFLAVAVASFGIFEVKSVKLLNALSVFGAVGAAVSIIRIFDLRPPDVRIIFSLLTCGGFLAATLFAMKLCQMEQKRIDAFDKRLDNLTGASERPDFSQMPDSSDADGE